VQVLGLTLHPAVDCPTWRRERRAFAGLWGRADESGARPVDASLAHEVIAQREAFARVARMTDETFFPGHA
jgi:ribosomal protein S7